MKEWSKKQLRKEFRALAECYDGVSQQLIDTENLLVRMNKLLTLVYIDRDMLTDWLDIELADRIDSLTDEYAALQKKYE